MTNAGGCVCGYRLEASPSVSLIDGEIGPAVVGDFHVCMGCGRVLILDAAGWRCARIDEVIDRFATSCSSSSSAPTLAAPPITEQLAATVERVRRQREQPPAAPPAAGDVEQLGAVHELAGADVSRALRDRVLDFDVYQTIRDGERAEDVRRDLDRLRLRWRR